MPSSCCGSYRKSKVNRSIEPLPTNPEIKGGIQVIYVGAGYQKIAGKISGYLYHVSDHHRHLKVASEDAPAILKRSDFMRKP